MEFQYRAGDARSPSTGAAATSANSESAATRVQGADYGGDGSGYLGENSEAVTSPRLASGPDDLWRRAAKERIRERILREQEETLALEAEVWRELLEERIPSLRSQVTRPAGVYAKGSEARAPPATGSPSLKTPIGHEVGSKPDISAALPAKRKIHHVAATSNVSVATSTKMQKLDLTCTVCGITATSEGAMQEHLNGKSHRRKTAKLAPPLSGAGHHEDDVVSSKVNGLAAWEAKGKNPSVALASTVFAATSSNEQKLDLTCTVCGITSTSHKAMQDHLEGKLHKRKAATLIQTMPKEDMVSSKPNASAAALLPAKQKSSHVVGAASIISATASSEKQKQDLTCTVCGITTPEEGMQDHLNGKAHMRKAATLAQPPEEAAKHVWQEESEEEGAYTPTKLEIVTNSKKLCTVMQMNGFLLCEVCGVTAPNLVTMLCHLEGAKHISKAKQQEEHPKAVVVDAVASGGDPELETVAVEVNGVRRVDGFLLCEFCDVTAESEIVMRSHLSGKKHTSKQKAAVDACAGGKAVLAQEKANKEVAVGTSVDITVTPGQQAKKAYAATVDDSSKLVVFDVCGVEHVVEKVDDLLLCMCCNVKAPSECVMRSHLVGKKHKAKAGAVYVGAEGKRTVLAEAKSKESASAVVDGTGRTKGQDDESVEKSAAEKMEVVPSATPQEDGADPVCASSVAPMKVDEHAEAGDDTAKAEEEKVDAKEEKAVETNGVAAVSGQEVKIQVEGKLFIVLRQADGSLSCALCSLHGCDKDRMLEHLYTREHWRKVRLSEHKGE